MITIRSQNRERLAWPHEIKYEYIDAWFDVSNRTPLHVIRDNLDRLGKYATRERCLEIIDEIQADIVMGARVYHMPAE